MIEWLLQMTPPTELPSWLSGLIAGGGSSAIMGFIVWHVFSKMIPSFNLAMEKTRNDFLQAQQKERDDYRATLEVLRRDFREEIKEERAISREGVERIIKALHEQNNLLIRLAGEEKKE